VSQQPTPTLTAAERQALTFWKWFYQAKAEGFPAATARRVAFARYLVWVGKIGEQDGMQLPSDAGRA
jgi:hypothetical protein